MCQWASAISIPDTTVFGTVLGNATLRGAILQRQTALLPMSLLASNYFRVHLKIIRERMLMTAIIIVTTPPYNTGILLSNSYCIGSTGD